MNTKKYYFELDPITLEIINSNLIALCREMGTVMLRTAYSPIFSEGRDFSTAMFDVNCEMVAQGVGCPAQLGALKFLVEWCIKDIGLENIFPGDIIFHNDVYRGGTHLPEFTMIKPIFYEDEIIAFASVIGHHVDVGGKSPGGFPGDATDVFMEGFRLPPVKLFIKGEPNKDIWRIYLSNVRTPKNSFGDTNAMYASVLRGEKRLYELINKYGVEIIKKAFNGIKDYSERRMRAEIEKIPDGLYEYEDYMDDDGVVRGGPYPIKVSILVDGDRIIADFTGSAPQTKGPINCPFGVTASATYNAIMLVTDPHIPTNSGCFRPIHLIAPSGTIVNVEYPGAEYGGNTETHNRIVDVVIGALSQAIPDKIAGSGASTCMNFTFGGIHPETGEQYANYQFEHGGWGARATKDGNNYINAYVGNSTVQGVEANEIRFPWLTKAFRLREDSGGAGKYRGGLGTVRIMKVTAPEIEVNALADRCLRGAPGVFGGMAGDKGGYFIKRKGMDSFKTFAEVFGTVSPSKFANIILKEGDEVMIKSPGGGGYGSPLEREREMVLNDLKQGYITKKTAKEVYKISLDDITD